MAEPTQRSSQAPPRTTQAEGDLSPAWPSSGGTRTAAPVRTDAPAKPATGDGATTSKELTGRAASAPAAAPAGAAAMERQPRVYTGMSPFTRMARLVWLACIVSELIVGLRVIFKALAVDATAGFVSFINTISSPMIQPFHSIMRDKHVGSSGLIESSAVIAMAVFLAAALTLVVLLRILAAPRARPVGPAT